MLYLRVDLGQRRVTTWPEDVTARFAAPDTPEAGGAVDVALQPARLVAVARGVASRFEFPIVPPAPDSPMSRGPAASCAARSALPARGRHDQAPSIFAPGSVAPNAGLVAPGASGEGDVLRGQGLPIAGPDAGLHPRGPQPPPLLPPSSSRAQRHTAARDAALRQGSSNAGAPLSRTALQATSPSSAKRTSRLRAGSAPR